MSGCAGGFLAQKHPSPDYVVKVTVDICAAIAINKHIFDLDTKHTPNVQTDICNNDTDFRTAVVINFNYD